jgi:hypothetical protein
MTQALRNFYAPLTSPDNLAKSIERFQYRYALGVLLLMPNLNKSTVSEIADI